jgi:hypothetical protein
VKRGKLCRRGLHDDWHTNGRRGYRCRACNNDSRRPQHVTWKYGIAREEYDALLVKQEGKCAICAEPMTPPQVDHDHVTGAVRGLLCRDCNVALGIMKDDATRLLRAAAYVKQAEPETTKE